MENEPKKISFGFSKSSKKPNIIKLQPKEEKKVEIIEYLEEKSIKVVGGDDKPKGPLVIPMKQPNKKLINLIDIVENNFEEKVPENENNDLIKTQSRQEKEDSKHLTLDELATKELLTDSNSVKIKEDVQRVIDVSKNTEKITFEGEKESTMDDYEEIPIEEFGKAMLRGMGWKDGHGIGKNQQLVKMSQPIQRPKGMGLGADKLTKQDKTEKPAVDRDGNALRCVKGAYVKIIAGYHKGNYGQIIGLDDESGRFIIKTALNNLNVSLNEFLVTPVTKEEYMKNSKVINNAKYEEYVKRKELEEKIKQEKENIKEESPDSSDEETKRKEKRKDSKNKKYDYSDDEGDKKRYIKKESKSSDSDEDANRSKNKTEKYDKRRIKKERYSSESDYDGKNRKYESSVSYKRQERDRKNRDKHKHTSSKRYSDESDSESEQRKSKKKSSKYDSDLEYEEKKKHKKKKSKKYSSDDDTDEKYKRKSKKSDKKKYDSDSDNERYKKKKDKYRDKRDRSKHDRR